MRAGEAMQVLRISRPTLDRWRKEGKITAEILPSGRYEFDDSTIYRLLAKGVPRKTVIYGRVSTRKQKTDLAHQLMTLKQFCIQNGWSIHAVYQDIASGISFESRKEFFQLLDAVMHYQVERVVVAYKDRLSRVGFGLFTHLFQQFGTEIIVMSDVGNSKLDSEEIFEEIVSLLHAYSMKLYSQRKKQYIKALTEPNDD